MASSKKQVRRKNSATRIGLFGGTFDPPHIGHLIIAQQALAQLRLDRVIFIPAKIPPHKRKNSFSKPLDRLRMARLVVRGLASFRVSDVEIKRRGVSYTVDTLREIQKRNRNAEILLIIGADNYAGFRTWKSFKEILKMAKLAVYARTGSRAGDPLRLRKDQVRLIRGARLDISSSEVRNAVRKNQSIRHLVPAAVERYIVSRKLYRR